MGRRNDRILWHLFVLLEAFSRSSRFNNKIFRNGCALNVQEKLFDAIPAISVALCNSQWWHWFCVFLDTRCNGIAPKWVRFSFLHQKPSLSSFINYLTCNIKISFQWSRSFIFTSDNHQSYDVDFCDVAVYLLSIFVALFLLPWLFLLRSSGAPIVTKDDIDAMAPYVDYFSVMTYDYSSPMRYVQSLSRLWYLKCTNYLY